MATIIYTGELIVTGCWCGITVGIPDDLYRYARRKKVSVYCPLGHSFVYGDPENEQLKEQVARLEARNTHLSDQRAAAERTATAYKGHNTRLRKRAAAGVCPAGCHRSFANLGRHMNTEHPGWGEEHPS